MILMYIHSQLKGKVRKNPFLDFLWANSRTSVLHVAKFPAILSPSANVFFQSPCLIESNSSLLSPTLALCSFPKCPVLLFLCVDSTRFLPWNLLSVLDCRNTMHFYIAQLKCPLFLEASPESSHLPSDVFSLSSPLSQHQYLYHILILIVVMFSAFFFSYQIISSLLVLYTLYLVCNRY